MHRVLSRDQIRSFDRIAIESCNVPGVILMENAGRGAAEVIQSLIDDDVELCALHQEVLESEGYISGFEVGPAPKGPGEMLTIKMKYSDDRDRTISGLRRISTPGLRARGSLGL